MDLATGEATGGFQMIVHFKNADTDPEPDAPEFEGFTLVDTNTDRNNSDADRGIRTTLFTYSIPNSWEGYEEVVDNADLPDYETPENGYTFQFSCFVRRPHVSNVYTAYPSIIVLMPVLFIDDFIKL